GDSLLAQSLRSARTRDGRPKQPQVAVLDRAGGGAPLQTPPTEAAPLVYHLFGNFQDMDGVVLTEDDYFDFLIDMASDRRQVPSGVLRALTRSSLLFLGFRLEEWDFRILVRCINALNGSDMLRGYAQVAVQLDPESGRFLDPAAARRYLNQHTRFAGEQIS